jgi:hypothetical protein
MYICIYVYIYVYIYIYMYVYQDQLKEQLCKFLRLPLGLQRAAGWAENH